MNEAKNRENGLSKQHGYCLSMHLAHIDGIDGILKDFISRFLKKYDGSWINGTYWQSKLDPDKVYFEKAFDEEIATFYKLISGIQTRVIGNVLIDTPSNLITNSESSSYILSFRKIHEEYEIMIFAFAKEAKTPLEEFENQFNALEKEIFNVWELFFLDADESLKNRYYLPTTVFYFVQGWNEAVSKEALIQNLRNPSSHFFKFINYYFCVQGTEPIKIPKSIIDDKFYVFRHPTYYYSQELSEKFLLIPVNQSTNLDSLIRTVDIISSIEFYFTKFFNLVRGVYELLSEIDEKSRTLISSFYKTEITTLKQEETEKELKKFISLSQELYPKFPLCEKVIAELEHLYSDASHIIGGITSNSVYSQASEKPFSDDTQGAIETIGFEFQMRLTEILRNLPRNLGRLYHDLNSITALIKSYYDLVKNEGLNRQDKESKFKELQLQTIKSFSGQNEFFAFNSTPLLPDSKVSINLNENNEGVLTFNKKSPIKLTSIEGDMLVLMVEQLKEDYKDLIDQKIKGTDEVGWVFYEKLIEAVQDWKIYRTKGNERDDHDISVVVSRINSKVREALGLEKNPENNLIQNGKKLNKSGFYRLVVDPLNVEVERL